MRGSQIGCLFYFVQATVLVAVAQKIILRVKENPATLTTSALLKAKYFA